MGKIVKSESSKSVGRSLLDLFIGNNNDGWIEFGIDKKNDNWWVRIIRKNK